jgi:hypothetical protein
VLAVVAFTVNALGDSANVTLDVDGEIAADGFSLGTLNDGDEVVIDFAQKKIWVNGVEQEGTEEFFAAAEGTDQITIGSASTGGDGFAIQDLQLTPTEPTPSDLDDPNFQLAATASDFSYDSESSNDPIILDLGEEGIELTSTAAFDLNNDGQLQTLAWPNGEDGILVMDLDGSGAIESGNEVFSPWFNGGGYADALDALASLDTNGDGVIDEQDEAFADLLVWVDANGDGISQPDELFSLADLGIVSLNLNAEDVDYAIDGQTVVSEGEFTYADGSKGQYVAVGLEEVDAPSNRIASDEEAVETDLIGKVFALSSADVLSNADLREYIADYSFVEGDWIDVSGLLEDLFGTNGSSEYVQLTASGDDINIEIDANGDGTGWTTVAVLSGYNTPGPDPVRIVFDDAATNEVLVA